MANGQLDGQGKASATERLAGVLERLEPDLKRVVQTIEREHRSSGWWKVIKRGGIVAIVIVIAAIYLTFYGAILGVKPSIAQPTVAVVDIEGPIGGSDMASAGNIVPILQNLCDQPDVRGVILHINSPGGSPGDAERIGAAVDRCKIIVNKDGEQVGKRRVVSVIDGMGASAAYMIAMHGDKVFANPMGMVGSIGVIAEGLKYPALLSKLGVQPYAYASGDLKATLSPYLQDTPAQQALMQQLVDTDAKVFEADVEAHRPHLVLSTPDLWSGRVWVAAEAEKIGLIDGIGVLENVEGKEFPHLAVQTFRPQRDIKSLLSMQTWVHAVASEVEQKGLQIN